MELMNRINELVQCATCCFFSPDPRAVARGQCRHMSPILIQRPDQSTFSAWPIVNSNAACGDHASIDIGAETVAHYPERTGA